MFWKKDKHYSVSIIGNLSGFFTIFSTLLLVLLGIGLYLITAEKMKMEDTQSLKDFASLIMTDMKKEKNIPEVIQKHLYQEVSAFHYHRYQLMVITPNRHLVFRSADFPLKQIDNRAIDTSLTEKNGYPLFECSKQQQHFIGTRFSLTLKDQQVTAYRVYVTMNVTPRYQFLSTLKMTLLWFVCFGSLLFCLVSFVILETGLKPLIQFRQALEQINFQNLEKRLASTPWPKEIIPLAKTFDLMMDKINEGVSQLKQFSSTVAHELKTPLAKMRVSTEVLLNKERTLKEYQTIITENLDELERLSGLIDRLLMLAQMENGTYPLERQQLSVAQLLSQLENYYELLLQEKHATFKIIGDALVHADKMLLSIVFDNLISNALKYSDHDSTITVVIDQPSREIVQIIFSDTGYGISTDQLEHIFNRFFRVETSRTRNPEGHGLGLAVVQSIMHLHRGHIEVESQLKKGTTFTLTLPVF